MTVLLLASCRGDGVYKNMKEGEIYYNIKYISNPSSMSTDLLPKELVIAFRGDLISTSLNDTHRQFGSDRRCQPEGEYIRHLS